MERELELLKDVERAAFRVCHQSNRKNWRANNELLAQSIDVYREGMEELKVNRIIVDEMLNHDHPNLSSVMESVARRKLADPDGAPNAYEIDGGT